MPHFDRSIEPPGFTQPINENSISHDIRLSTELHHPIQHLHGQLHAILVAQEIQIDVAGPDVEHAPELVHVGEEPVDEGEVAGPAEAGDEAGVGEGGEGEAAEGHLAVAAVGEVEAGAADEGADEAVVVGGEDAAVGAGHFVEHLEGAVDEAGLDVVGNAGAVYQAGRPQPTAHVRGNALSAAARGGGGCALGAR